MRAFLLYGSALTGTLTYSLLELPDVPRLRPEASALTRRQQFILGQVAGHYAGAAILPYVMIANAFDVNIPGDFWVASCTHAGSREAARELTRIAVWNL